MDPTAIPSDRIDTLGAPDVAADRVDQDSAPTSIIDAAPADKGDEAGEDTSDVAITQASNPMASGGNGSPENLPVNVPPIKSPAGNAEDGNKLTKKQGKRGRPPGSKNKAGKKKSAAKKPTSNDAEDAFSPKDALPPSAQVPPTTQAADRHPVLQWIDRTRIERADPFNNLLPINPEVFESIKASMLEKGLDPTHPVHVWDRDGTFILVDGHTRDKAAGEVGIPRLLAFVHRFQDEPEAVGFAVEGQMARRNLTSGDQFLLIGVYDEKVKPGSVQECQEDGTFAPRASNDAGGKSAAKTAEKLKTTATNVERIRYLHKHADAQTKAKVTDNKLSISGACKVVQKQLATQPPKEDAEPKADTKKDRPSPFEPTTDSDVAHAVWRPVVQHHPEPDTEGQAGAEAVAEDLYDFVDELLELPPVPKKLSEHDVRRIFVLPGLDLFADRVSVKTVRAVLQTAAAAKQFKFLFTTQNPARLGEFSWEENTFAGVSIFGQKDVAPAEDALQNMDGLGKWLVVEQLTMKLSFLTAQGQFSVRVPHAGEMYIDPTRYFLSITSNGMEATKDLANRAAFVRLEKQPNHRIQTFGGKDILTTLRERQPMFLGALFKVVRHWFERGMPRTDENRHTFAEWARANDWIVRNIFGEAPLLEGHVEAQQRFQDPNLSFARLVAIEVASRNQVGLPLTATEIFDLCDHADIPIPHLRENQRHNADYGKKLVGKAMTKLFGSQDTLTIEGFVVTREHELHKTDAGNTQDLKHYTFARADEQAAQEGAAA